MEPFELKKDLERLRKNGKDDETVEVKSWGRLPSSKGSKTFWESLSAFANTNGGYILLGLSEPDFTPVEGFDSQASIQFIRAGLNPQDRDALKVEPVPHHEIHKMTVDGAEVVLVSVSPLAVNGPCYYLPVGIINGSFKRVGDEDRKLSHLEIYELQNRFVQTKTDRNPVPDSSINDLNNQLVASFKQRLVETGSRSLGTDDNWLLRKNITTPIGELTIAGLLALGSYPQQFFPRVIIDVAVHPGLHKSPIGTSIRFEDRKICEGNLLEMVQEAMTAIKRNLRVRRVVEGLSGKDVLEIPEEVLREALANAVLHRDYSELAQNEAIHVDIYKDRVEITSPGGLPNGKRPESILDGYSEPRNRVLSRILMDIPWTHEVQGVLAESNGTGVPRMFNLMREAGLPVPNFKIDISSVTVELSRHGLLDTQTNEWLVEKLGSDFSNTQGIALVLAKELGAVTPRDLRNQTGHDSEDMRSLLDALVDRGVLNQNSQNQYQLATSSVNVTQSEQEVLDAINKTTPVTIREIATKTGKTASSLRPLLRGLVEAGLVVATAPPSSRNRAYLKA
ncbi:putative transcriptional regulator [Corynebacterium glutamicum MT]|uniref:ATPase n=1 Tax=Corynebacterium glutamicum TaxID=1718 RepID=A0AB36IC56_CORGT|nr:ATP-binding protein [Corynebacterium glutamicum]AGN17634.1 transcriptional regulator [Corynebacterium glutamicum SCgG1]AGN20657.1 transcriptional regulator [Corynebacterium glutamicum SCgG2]EGV41244.1 transcriptional regulator [Corynebacterium glutamicum S9114]EOA63946.1 putative transcriptional regulator [Corynebacterium glutamicum MT]EPP39373.1 transcriptional regulator [Corynebacterium glutamicum Z188]